MCGIAALQLRNEALRPRLGELLNGMLCEVIERGPDAAGIAIYDSPEVRTPGAASLSIIGTGLGIDPAATESRLGLAGSGSGWGAGSGDQSTEQDARLAPPSPVALAVSVAEIGESTLVTAPVSPTALADAVRAEYPHVTVTGRGEHVAVLKSVGNPRHVAANHGVPAMGGTQALSHTRMATESAVTAQGSHPFSVGDDLCLVHNGSFSNHASVRRELQREGIEFDSENDTEVGARFVADRLERGDDLATALTALGAKLDGFYTLVVTTQDTMAVVRDPIACKPAVIAETDDYVAMASEFRALATLPGIEDARIFEPEPGIVYTWKI